MLYIEINHKKYSVPKKTHKAMVPHQCDKCGTVIKKGQFYRKGTITNVTTNGYCLYENKFFCINCCDKEEKTNDYGRTIENN